jgi:hypothetical protein
VGREATTNGRPYVISFLMRIAVLIAASIQSLAKYPGQAITPLQLGVRKISTLANGPAKGYGGSRTSLCVLLNSVQVALAYPRNQTRAAQEVR